MKELEELIVQGNELIQFEKLVTQKIHNYCFGHDFNNLNNFLTDLFDMMNKITHIKTNPGQQIYYTYHFYSIAFDFCNKNNLKIRQNELDLIIQSYLNYAENNAKNSINKIITFDTLNNLLDGLNIQDNIKIKENKNRQNLQKIDFFNLHVKIYSITNDINFYQSIHRHHLYGLYIPLLILLVPYLKSFESLN